MSAPPEPEVTLVRKNINFAEQEWMFCNEINYDQLSQSDALKRTPLPIFAKNVTYDAKNVYFSGSFLQQFEHLQREFEKDAIPDEIQTRLREEASAGDDVQLISRWRQNYLYEVIPSDTACHLYFDIDGSAAEGPERKVLDEKQQQLFDLSCKELNILLGTTTVNGSMFVLDASDAVKYSRHLILHFPGFAFKNNAHCGAFVRYLYGKYNSELEGYGVDLTVYSKNRLFRSAYCSKGKSPKRIFWPHSVVTSSSTILCTIDHSLGPRSSLFHESLVTNVFLFHRVAYLPYIDLIVFDEPFLTHYGSTILVKKRKRDSTGSRYCKRPSTSVIGTRFDIWNNPFLELCRRDIAKVFAYNPISDFQEYCILNTDISIAKKTIVFPMRTGVCSFRPTHPHSSEHSYVVVDLTNHTFRAQCHSQKSPCVESKGNSVSCALSSEVVRLHKENERYNNLVLDFLPSVLYLH